MISLGRLLPRARGLKFESLRGGFPSRWEYVGFCPIGASIRGWHGLRSGYVLWNRITNYYSRLAGTTFWLSFKKKCDAAERAYEAQREKDLAIKKCEEMRFLMIDTSNLPPHKRAFIERQQAEIMRKYQDAGADDAGADV
ncbi:hypothetical protein Tco_0667070 [Tanacetum coccineum]